MAKKEAQATDEQGNIYVVRGGKWVKQASTVGGPAGLKAPEKKVLNDLNDKAATATEVQEQYRRVGKALNDLNPGPMRGAFLDAAIPEDGGGVLDALGGALIGGPARLIGALPQRDIDNFQTVKGIQSAATQQKQTLQKGVQTEGDAARIMLSDISPYKGMKANNEIIQAGNAKLQREKTRSAFYTRWANTYGLNGLNPKGQSVEQVFNANYGPTAKRMGMGGGGVTITKVK